MDSVPPSSLAQPEPGVVVVVDDDPDVRLLVERILEQGGMTVRSFSRGDEALAALRDTEGPVDAILLDVMLPGLDGFAVLEALAADARTRAIPVILLTAHATQESDFVRSATLGAVDHVTKPFSPKVLLAKVKSVTARALRERALALELERAERHATIDPLTGLMNRRMLDERLRQEASRARRGGAPLSVALLDLDHFKKVNDTHGHAAGDVVLRHVSDVLRGELRAEDAAFRYGGEEIVVLLAGSDARASRAAVDRIREKLCETPVDVGEATLHVSFSAGVAAADAGNGFDVASILERADAALYRAKAEGRNRVKLEGPPSAPPGSPPVSA